MTHLIRIVFLLLLVFSPLVNAEDNYKQLSCIMHIHSTYSGGKTTTFKDIIKQAKDKNIDIVIPTDHDIMKWEYGIYPLRNILKKTYSMNSILQLGPDNYLNDIHNIEKDNPEMIIIPGTESTPFYYWTGSPFNNSLIMNSWHKHILVIGLDKPEDYNNLPLVSNHKAGVFDITMFWPVFIFGLIFLLPRTLFPVIIFAGLLMLTNNYPFKKYNFDQYHGDRGELPYQNLINYADSKNALTYWAHPESPNYSELQKKDSVGILTSKYPESILNTYNYTGFAIFQEGYRNAGSIGGYWDQALIEYCTGKRKKPVWTVGELDFGATNTKIDDIQNILLLKDLSKTNALDALKNGRYFLFRKNNATPLISDIQFKSGSYNATLGEELDFQNNFRLSFNLKASDNGIYKSKIMIIRDGKLVNILETETPASINYENTDKLAPGKHFYRIVIDADKLAKIVFNPVFINCE